MARERWATFDCYGTLIDWNAGIKGELERLFGVEDAPRLLERYHELEPEVQAEAYRSYGEVLTLTLMRLADAESLAIPEGEADALARSLPEWTPFPEVRAVARGASEPRLEARDPLELRPRPDRCVAAADRRAVRPHRSSPRTSARTNRHTGTGSGSARRRARTTRATSTSPRACFTTSHRRTSSGFARSGSTASVRSRAPAPTRELPDLSHLPETLDELVAA